MENKQTNKETQKKQEPQKNKVPQAATLEDKPFFSDKKNVVRLIAFLVAFVIGVGGISYGVYRIGYKEPGTYEIEADPDGDLPYYSSGVTMYYTFDGSSKQIREKMLAVKSRYTIDLKQTYQWFDAQNTYLGVVNLATVNQSPDQPITVPEPLFAALEDALVKTDEGQGYSVFAGPLETLRDSLIYATDPTDVDPISDPSLAETAAALADVIRNDPGTLSLDADARTVTLHISDAYAALLAQYGLEPCVLSLGLLRDAYRVQYLVKQLEDQGFTNGYLTTESGMTVLLRDCAAASYCFYSLTAAGKVVMSATQAAASGTAACCFRLFGLYEDEVGFYTMTRNGATIYRHPYMSSFTETQPVMAAMAISGNRNIVTACYTCVCLFAAETQEQAETLAKNADLTVIMDLNDGENVLRITSDEGLSTVESFTVQTVA